jgi:hypothetical protein
MKTSKKVKILAGLLLFLSTLFYVSSVNALTFDELVETGKKLLGTESTYDGDLNITSEIKLTEDGDTNKNGDIDSGEEIRFSYVIENPTDKKHVFATLSTQIERNTLNYINNIRGVTGLTDDETITFPNLRIESGQKLSISFDATINFFSDQDKIISTEPELFSEDKKSLKKSAKQEIKALKVKAENIPSQIKKVSK